MSMQNLAALAAASNNTSASLTGMSTSGTVFFYLESLEFFAGNFTSELI